MRADFQRYYGLDIDEIGFGIAVHRAASLASCLPSESLTVRRLNDGSIPFETLDPLNLLAVVTNCLDFISWSKTAAAQKRGAEWRPRFITARRRPSGDVVAVTPDELERRLRLPRSGSDSNV